MAQPFMLCLCVRDGSRDRKGSSKGATNNFVHIPNLCAFVLPFCHSTPCFVEDISPSDPAAEAAVTRAGTGRLGETMMFPRAIGPSGG